MRFLKNRVRSIPEIFALKSNSVSYHDACGVLILLKIIDFDLSFYQLVETVDVHNMAFYNKFSI